MNAKCNIASKLVSMGAETGKKNNTSNVWNHLKCHHLPAFKEAKKKSARADILQPTITQMFDAQRKWQKSNPRSKQMYTLIAE